MTTGIITPKEYRTVLLTGVMEKGEIVERIKLLYHAGKYGIIPCVLLLENTKRTGYLVADGNHRLMAAAELQEQIRAYVIENPGDRDAVLELHKEKVIATGGLLLGDFLERRISFPTFRQLAEDAYHQCGGRNLEDYLADWRKNHIVSPRHG